MSLSFTNLLFLKKIILKSLPGGVRFPIRKKGSRDHVNKTKEIPRCIRLPGVYTLEAAVVMPLAACFFVSILFFFRVMQVQLEVQKVLDDTGRKLAVYLANREENHKADVLAANALFFRELAEREEVQKYVEGGRLGISLLNSEFDGDDIRLRAVYSIRLPVDLLGVHRISVEQEACCRKWTGFKACQGDRTDDIWVYLTPNASVYHTIRSCTHLKLSIQSVDRTVVFGLRNENGEKYYECERCAEENNNWGRVYITNQGNRYHKDLNCSGIKRTIYMVRLSEIDGLGKCGKCKDLE